MIRPHDQPPRWCSRNIPREVGVIHRQPFARLDVSELYPGAGHRAPSQHTARRRLVLKMRNVDPLRAVCPIAAAPAMLQLLPPTLPAPPLIANPLSAVVMRAPRSNQKTTAPIATPMRHRHAYPPPADAVNAKLLPPTPPRRSRIAATMHEFFPPWRRRGGPRANQQIHQSFTLRPSK